MLFAIMHIVHLLTVIIWIGGLAFVTMIALPMSIKNPDPIQKVLGFQRVEHRFAPMAKYYNIVVGITGLVMLVQNGWHRLLFTRGGIPLTFMVVVWVFWFVMLVGLEPILIKRMLERMARSGDAMSIESVFKRMNRLHWALLMLSLAASAAGALVAHGF